MKIWKSNSGIGSHQLLNMPDASDKLEIHFKALWSVCIVKLVSSKWDRSNSQQQYPRYILAFAV